MEATVTASLKPLLPQSKIQKTVILFTDHQICLSPLKFSALYYHSSALRSPTVRCIGGDGSSSEAVRAPCGLEGALAGMVDGRVEALLGREENRALLDGLEKATMRVEIAKKEFAEVERREIEAKMVRVYVRQLENRASEIAECQKDISEALLMVEEAERNLCSRKALKGIENETMDKRKESFNAALISAVVGTIAGLPISLTRVATMDELILQLAITSISCALFGVTFRYMFTRDLDNFWLKTGTPAAFGLAKGLAELTNGSPLELNDPATFFSHAAMCISDNLLVFLFAAVGLDLCMKLRILSPFP
ncbi:unnamed protein product [Cuscuta campestris]|uniref:Uncharacterized protein n=1 Tax=Cuscuta campestris TaxID=132261 RepID=A0A484KA66_9ASTE|nr:unnamed protein product [Cuscuta campestris]